MILRAEITGANRCEAEGITTKGRTPVLTLCRKLIAAGYDPNRPLHAYRGDMLALKISSIGYGAGLTVKEAPDETPRFGRYQEAPQMRRGASPMRYFGEAVSLVPDEQGDASEDADV